MAFFPGQIISAQMLELMDVFTVKCLMLTGFFFLFFSPSDSNRNLNLKLQGSDLWVVFSEKLPVKREQSDINLDVLTACLFVNNFNEA